MGYHAAGLLAASHVNVSESSHAAGLATSASSHVNSHVPALENRVTGLQYHASGNVPARYASHSRKAARLAARFQRDYCPTCGFEPCSWCNIK